MSRPRLDPPGLGVSVTGRDTPRVTLTPVVHDVRFYGALTGFAAAGNAVMGISARCEPCRWSVGLEGGHDLADLARLAAMHAGEEA